MTAAQQLFNQGISRGRHEGLVNSILDALEVRFGDVPAGLVEVIQEVADEGRLRVLLRQAVTCASIDAFTRAL